MPQIRSLCCWHYDDEKQMFAFAKALVFIIATVLHIEVHDECTYSWVHWSDHYFLTMSTLKRSLLSFYWCHNLKVAMKLINGCNSHPMTCTHPCSVPARSQKAVAPKFSNCWSIIIPVTFPIASELQKDMCSSSWVRTSDLMVNSHTLYQLSYRGSLLTNVPNSLLLWYISSNTTQLHSWKESALYF